MSCEDVCRGRVLHVWIRLHKWCELFPHAGILIKEWTWNYDMISISQDNRAGNLLKNAYNDH